MKSELCQRVIQAANTLRICVPRLVDEYLDRLPDEGADSFFEESFYDGLPEETSDLFYNLLGLCERFKADREAEITGKPWRWADGEAPTDSVSDSGEGK